MFYVCLLHIFLSVALARPAHNGLSVANLGRDQRLVILPLSRKLTKLGATASAPSKSYYVGKIQIGAAAPETRQEMLVFFDSGSGQVILDSTRCNAPACLKHHQYSTELSGAPTVNLDGRIAAPGTGSDSATIGLDSNDAEPGYVRGNFVRDLVCLGAERSIGSRMDACAEIILVAATNMTNQPFLDAPFDGIVGLGLEGLSVSSNYNFFSRLIAQAGLQPQFALFVPNQAEGGRAEISFGGHRPERLAGPLAWVPVSEPEVGFWQVAVKSVRIGDQTLDICHDDACRGYVDSSSSQLGVPDKALAELEVAIGLKDESHPSQGVRDCTDGPELHLVLEGETTLTLTAREYVEVSETGACNLLLHPLRNTETAGAKKIGDKERREGTTLAQSFVLGEPVLRRYYTAFDWDLKRIGFGLAATRTTAPSSKEAYEDEKSEHVEEFILLQTNEERKSVKVHHEL